MGDIEIVLDQAGILMLGQQTATAAAGSLDTVLNSTNYGFLGDMATSNGGAVAAEAAQYVLSNIGFSIVRMDMPAYFYEAMAKFFYCCGNCWRIWKCFFYFWRIN
jgi:hypothetical protein